METVRMEQDLWAAMYLSLLEYGVCLCRQGAPPKHVRMLLDVLIPPVACAAGRPGMLAELEGELRAVLAARERAIASITN